MVSEERLAELKDILTEEYGILLTDAEIEDLGNTLVTSFQILSEPNDLDEVSTELPEIGRGNQQ